MALLVSEDVFGGQIRNLVTLLLICSSFRIGKMIMCYSNSFAGQQSAEPSQTYFMFEEACLGSLFHKLLFMRFPCLRDSG